MTTSPLIFAATSDIAGQTRGKGFPAAQREKRLEKGIGWVPTNVQITCFDSIADSPFGSVGDLALIPDPETETQVDLGDGARVEHFMLGDIVSLEDGSPWAFCTRSILKAALERLERAGDVRPFAAFEHEFQLKGGQGNPGEAFALQAFAAHRGLGEALMGALEQAGIDTDTFLKEFGADQFEVTNGPALGVTAADWAVKLREITRLVARRQGEEATFTPIRDPEGVGNGVHLHLSFHDVTGHPVTYDGNHPQGMSQVTGQFIAGVLKYLDSILAFTAPTAISYLRLTPHRWSAAFNNLGYRDREASVRICPVSATSSEAIAKQYNFEVRALDAAASPYLAMAAILHAGAQGIEDGLAIPEVSEGDLSLLSAEELAAQGYVRLPQSLDEALERLEGNATVRGWFDPEFVPIYLAHKRAELAHVKDLSEAEQLALYEQVY